MKTDFEKMGGTYRQEGDYLLPNIAVPPELERCRIGKYGLLRRDYLKNYKPGIYTGLLMEGELANHLEEIERECSEQVESLISAMKEREGVTEALKASDHDGSCEKHRRHIRPSPRTIDREKSQAGGRKTVEFAVGVRHQFVAHFRRGIKAHGLRDLVVLAVRNLRIHPINRTRRGVNQMLDAVVPTRFEHVQKAHDVALQVGVRVRDAVAHAGLRRHIHDLLEFFAFHQAVERGFVVDGHPNEAAIRQRRAPNLTPPLDFRRVGRNAALAQPTVLQSWVVIVVDIVDSDDFIASLGQFLHQFRADESGSSCH